MVHQNGETPLFRCCQNGNERMAELLLQNGADVNFSSLVRGAELCMREMTSFEQRSSSTPIIAAAMFGTTDFVDLFLQHGANINAVDHIKV